MNVEGITFIFVRGEKMKKKVKEEHVLYRWVRMKKYTAIYFISRWHKDPFDKMYCTNCYRTGQDVHHLRWRVWEVDWIPLLYHPKYLSFLCRKCHTKCEMNELDEKKIEERERIKIKMMMNCYDEFFTPCK